MPRYVYQWWERIVPFESAQIKKSAYNTPLWLNVGKNPDT